MDLLERLATWCPTSMNYWAMSFIQPLHEASLDLRLVGTGLQCPNRTVMYTLINTLVSTRTWGNLADFMGPQHFSYHTLNGLNIKEAFEIESASS